MSFVDAENKGFVAEGCDFISAGTILDKKYVIGDERLSGGMAVVYRATGLVDQYEKAVKVPLPLQDLELLKLSFNREIRALSDLSHKNIVKLVDSGSIQNAPYLVLEWLSGGDLKKRVEQNGPTNWSLFYESIGRPLLLALVYAHQRRWAHRDLKPQNIMFDNAGTPKIVDFGIARQTNLPQIGKTFFQAGSPPYTPAESDDGYRSDRRDLYSWAAIATSCLTGKLFHDAEEMCVHLETLRDFSAPKEILRKALAKSPDERHETASILLSELDVYHASAISEAEDPIAIFIEIESTCIQSLRSKYPSLEENESIDYIIGDINTTWSAYVEKTSNELHIYGSTLRLKCKIKEFSLCMFSLNIHTPDRARELREFYPTVAGVTFSAGKLRDFNQARDSLRTFLSRLDVVDSVRVYREEETRRSKWFDCWSDFLRYKERQMKFKQRDFLARRIEDDGEFLVATIEGDFNLEDLGPSLVLHTDSGKPIILTVVDVEADQVKLSLRSGKRSDIKVKNAVLQTNFEAERKSIQKQR